VPRKKGESPNKITENWIGGLASFDIAMKSEPQALRELAVISGHFPFGIHKHLERNPKYITLLREPIARVVSTTNFDYQRGYVNKESAKDYLLNAEIDNTQTRLLAGEEFMTGPCNDETFEAAKKNIEEHHTLTLFYLA
jgi:hypothetical protein